MMYFINRISATEDALELIHMLKEQHGALMFYQSGGCCDGSAPMCYERGELKIGDNDVLLGMIAECPFYVAYDQYQYLKHSHLSLEVAQGLGSSFSLEIGTGFRFLIKSRLFTKEECAQLDEWIDF